MLGKISSSVDKLNDLNKKYNWIPNEKSIRPDNEVEKKEYINYLITNYGSIKNGTIMDIFKISNLENIQPTKLFQENKFKYNVSGNHYVMWYLMFDERFLTDDIINCDIYCNIIKILGNNNFNFAWYKNPKMTVPEIFHVQVFWKKK